MESLQKIPAGITEDYISQILDGAWNSNTVEIFNKANRDFFFFPQIEISNGNTDSNRPWDSIDMEI